MLSSRGYRYSLQILRCFHLPHDYKPNTRLVKQLPFGKRLKIWWNSLHPSRLQVLQDQLVRLLFPLDLKENEGINTGSAKTRIDDDGNYINEVYFEVVNDPSFQTKHVVFLHGYGASLGCFARNFHIINSLKGLENNYKVHFLDNISFGLSSNPKIPSINYWKPIPRMDHIKLHDTRPTRPEDLYKKYYKLVDLFDFDTAQFQNSKKLFKPILEDMEYYYTDALENWRINSGINKIDYLIGHSFGGYWSASYALKNPDAVNDLILLSPVGMERTAYTVNTPIPDTTTDLKPSLGPNEYNFLSRYPILSKNTILRWYYLQPYLPRLLKFMGPFGVGKYYNMWYSKLFAINKVILKLGGPTVFKSTNELKYGTNTECQLLVEYLYNSISNGTHSDTHIKYLLTPATTSKWPLFDKFTETSAEVLSKFTTHVIYGLHDFMNSEAGRELVNSITQKHSLDNVHYYEVPEGGHNLYLQNPFGTNKLLADIISRKH